MFRLRYKLSEILMIAGISLGIIVSFHTLSMIFLVLSSQKEEDYRNSHHFWIYNSELRDVSNNGNALSYFTPSEISYISFDDFLKTISAYDGYKEIIMPMPIGDSIDSRNVTGITELSEYRHKLKSGRWSADTENVYDGIVWIGESWEPYISNDGEHKTISIGSLKYRVQGVLDNTMTIGLDETVFLLLPSCSTESRCSIERLFNESAKSIGSLELSIFYDEEDKTSSIESMKRSLEETGLSTMQSFITHRSKEDSFALYVPLMLIVLILGAFSVMNLLVVSSFYFNTRHLEMCIRKTFGFRSGALIRLIVMDLGKLFSLSMFVVIPVEIILMVCNSSLAFRISDSFSMVIICLLSFLLIMLLLVGRFFVLFRKVRAIDLVAR